jgi:hypothetical protein
MDVLGSFDCRATITATVAMLLGILACDKPSKPTAVAEVRSTAEPAAIAPSTKPAPAEPTQQPALKDIVAREVALGMKLSTPPDCRRDPCIVPKATHACAIRDPLPDGFGPDVSSSSSVEAPGASDGLVEAVVCQIRDLSGADRAADGYAFLLWDVPEAPDFTYAQELDRKAGFQCDGTCFTTEGDTVVATKVAVGPGNAQHVERYRFVGDASGRGRFVRRKR